MSVAHDSAAVHRPLRTGHASGAGGAHLIKISSDEGLTVQNARFVTSPPGEDTATDYRSRLAGRWCARPSPQRPQCRARFRGWGFYLTLGRGRSRSACTPGARPRPKGRDFALS